MAENKPQDITLEKLKSRKKTVTAIMYMVGSLIILFAIYFIYLLAQHEWNPKNIFLAVVMGGMAAVIASLTAIRAGIDIEIRKRTGN